ncbi:hypothetical protein [Schleiferilactobacillus perolens]|uniref:hypothetical protein n=1 Tax=Schleiferilactobacillus perolens TaxID=100468 RepID=UPI0023530AD1|nr:hypothetical protein [Schleiferilactobacillus perolens]MCI2171153.1 hypothetical protein [Schleiferilactobacillus perolens]
MAEETDFLLRQIKGIAGSMGYILGKRAEGDPESAVIFPADKPPLPYQESFRKMLTEEDYQGALSKFLKIQYAMETDEYVKLGLWLYDALTRLTPEKRAAAGITMADLQKGLDRLADMEGE